LGMGFAGRLRCVKGLDGEGRRRERVAWEKGEERARRGMVVRSMLGWRTFGDNVGRQDL